MKRFLSLLLACVMLVCMLPVSVFAADTQTTPMYRLYNPNSGEHFYTGSMEEKDNLVSVGWNYEGIAWNAPIKGGDPVHRLFNPNSGDHHYTMSKEESDMLVSVGWQYEGVCWNSVAASDPDAVPLYRLYNPNADCGSHHYTTSVEERDNLVAVGWILEGIGWFGAGDHVHEFKAATCTEPKTCKVCGAEEGEALDHSYSGGVCSVCGKPESNLDEVIDTAALEEYGRSYAESNYEFVAKVGTCAWYYPAYTCIIDSMNDGYAEIEECIDDTAAELIATRGSTKTYLDVGVEYKSDNTYIVTVYYG